MAIKRSSRKARAKKAATLSAAAMTATALTAGVAPIAEANSAVVSREVALMAGPNYTQLVNDSSNSLNNVLFAAGNFGGAAAGLWNPLAAAFPGGVLPTFYSGTGQEDLSSVDGFADALSALSDVFGDLNLDAIPGLPDGASTAVLAGLIPGLAPAALVFALANAPLLPVTGIEVLLSGLSGIRGVTGVPSIDELIEGLSVTQTTYSSGFDWPILGGSGNTTVSNLFAQLPEQSFGDIIAAIQGEVDVPNNALTKLFVAGLFATANAALGGVETPSVTAWLPSGSGNYSLLGGSYGWLAAMPTLVVGPVDLGAIGESGTETVVAIPIFAQGLTLPMGLASMAMVTSPGALFPTATGVSTLGGTTVQSFGIPLLGIDFSVTNLLQSTYVGTNGFNVNSGTTIAALTTPFGTLPIVFSLGGLNAGSTGFGFTLPSLFTVGVAPSFQVGTAPNQQSPDGVIPASVLNLGLELPTQTTDVASLLGLPDVGGAVSNVLTPVFNVTIAPIGETFTEALNEQAGPLVNDFVSTVEQLTAAIADLSEQLPEAGTPPAVEQEQNNMLAAKTGDPAPPKIEGTEAKSSEGGVTEVAANTEETQAVLETGAKKPDDSTKASAKKMRQGTQQAVKKAQDRVNKVAENGRKQVKAVTDGVKKAVKETRDAVKKAISKPAKKTQSTGTDNDNKDSE